MARAETRTLLAADVWASSAAGALNRQNPEDLGITRTAGFGIEYQQANSGFYPPRTVFNQRYHEWEHSFRHKLFMGIPEYHADINYRQHAFCQVDGVPYVASVANGPALGNVTDPTATPNAIWRRY